MNILILSEFYPPHVGGVEIVMQQIAEGAAQSGHNVSVITTAAGNAPTFERDKNLTVTRLAAPRFLIRFWFLLGAILPAIKAAKNTDIVHCTTYAAAIPAILAAKLRKKRSLITVHELMGRKWFDFLSNKVLAFYFYQAERIMARFSFDKFVAVSNYTAEMLLEAGAKKEKINVIYNGVFPDVRKPGRDPSETRALYAIDRNDHVFLYYGRAGITKGVTCLADALNGIIETMPNARMLLVVSNYDRRIYKYLQEKVRRVDANRVRLIEPQPRPELINMLHAADTVVIPSLSEGFGFSTVESAAAGAIVVAARAGAIPEVISGRYILVQPASAEALIEGCLKAVRGEFEVKPNRQFKWEESIRKYIAIYQHLNTL